MKRKLFFIVAVICIATGGCYKKEHQEELEKPGIVLTFDDKSIDNWYRYLPLLDSFGAKATFYISSYHSFSAEQKNKLKKIQNRGHEIGYHTTFHNNLCEYLKLHGLDDLMDLEIKQDLRKMCKDGYSPVSFAYPYGAHNYYLDNQLLPIFKSVRALNGTNDLEKSIAGKSCQPVLYAIGMDNNGRSIATIGRLMEQAVYKSKSLVLVGHQIENPNAKFQVPYEKLKFILQKAKDLNMKYYTASEICN